MSELEFNINDKQRHFNKVKGEITELLNGEKYCSVTLQVGHEHPRLVNFSMRKNQYEAIQKKYAIGSRVVCYFFITSKEKYGRYYTIATLLDLQVDNFFKNEQTSQTEPSFQEA